MVNFTVQADLLRGMYWIEGWVGSRPVRRNQKSLTSAGNRTMIPLSSSVLISAMSGVYQVGEELQIYFWTAEINRKSCTSKKD